MAKIAVVDKFSCFFFPLLYTHYFHSLTLILPENSTVVACSQTIIGIQRVKL